MENNPNNNIYSEFMSGDYNNNNRNENSTSNKTIQQQLNINGDIGTNIKTKFSVNAKPFISTKDHLQKLSKTAVSSQVNSIMTQNTVYHNHHQQQQLRLQQQNPLINHPLNQLLSNSPNILQNLNSLLINNIDKIRLAQQIYQKQQHQQIVNSLTQSNLNVNDLVTLATLSNLASNVLSSLPSSLQQFYTQLNASNQKNQQNDTDENRVHKSTSKVNNQNDDTELKSVDKEKALSILKNPKSKSKLEFDWSFWFFKKNNKDAKWEDNIIFLTTVDNVEDFWSVYNHLRPVSDLHEGCDYMFFKKGIRPMWEDSENRDGGRWFIGFDREQRYTLLNTVWLNTLLALIGSQYDNEFDLVNGAVVNVRYKIDKLALWTKHHTDAAAQCRIGKRFMRSLELNGGLSIFEVHDTNQQLFFSNADNVTL